MGKFKNFVSRIKAVKNIEIYIASALGLLIIAVLLLSGVFSAKNTSKSAVDDSYISQMEHKIVSVVEKIEGCGKVTAAVSYSAYEEKVYAYETEKSPSGAETSTVVLVKGEPLVIKTLPPNILGVVIVAEGADNPIIKMKIIEAVVTLLDVDVSKVQVFTHKS